MSNSATAQTKAHWTLWLVGIIALLWHLGGCMNFFMQLNPEMLAKMPDSHRAIAESRPVWATAAFALSVITGVLGAILLLLKRNIALPLFVLSLIGAIVATLHGVLMGNALGVMNPGEIVMAVFGPVVFGIFLVWFASMAKKRRWLR